VSSLAEATREQLMATNEHYQNLRKEHTQYASELEQLASKAHLSEQEQLEEIRLKKLKLRVKDEMEKLVHQQAQAH
jgi:uncharacterized protein